MRKSSEVTLIFIGSLVVFVSILISVTLGAANITPLDTIKIIINNFKSVFDPSSFPINSEVNILVVRLPRVLGAAIAGMGLSLSGIIFQSILKNPLAEPYILGVSSGAALGASIPIVLSISVSFIPTLYTTPFFALVGALIASLTVIFISGSGSESGNRIILYGVSFNFLLSSILTLIISLNINRSKEYLYWAMGRFTTMNSDKVLILFFVTLICTLISIYYIKELNLFTMGQPVAKSLGLNIKKYRMLLLTVASILTGVIVSFAGIIGFVGLVIPHLARLFVGSENRRVIYLSLPMGAVYLILCDAIARSVTSNGIPVGVVTSIIGAPIFIYLLKKRGKI